MRNLTTVLLRATLLLFAFLATNSMLAYDVEIDGIFYDLKNSTATVTYDGIYQTSSCGGDVVIPSSIVYNGMKYTVTTIGKSAFSSSNITSVDIPNTVTNIEKDAFYGCTSLSSVNLPNTITAIKSSTFCNCRSLSSIQIPNSVITIGDWAFSGSGLTSIDIPNSVIAIGYHAFHDTPWYEKQPDGVVYAGSFVYKYKGDVPENTSIIIKPGTRGIVTYAFLRCENIVSIEFPNTLRYIGEDAFSGTTWYKNQPEGLIYAGQVALHYKGTVPPNTDLVIKDGTLAIGEGAFFIENYLGYDDNYDDGLMSVTIPNSVKYIGYVAFIGCDNLRRVIIGNGVEEMGRMAFSENKNLTDVTISEGVKVIGEQMFASCTSLRKIIIPNSAEVIRYRAFGEFDDSGDIYLNGCISLTDVTIGSGVKTIESYAFSGCSSLPNITIPANVKTIKENAFLGCKALTQVTCLATIPPVLEDVSCFDEDNYTEAILYVPKGSESDYMTAYGWKNFINIVGIDVHTDACDVNGDGVVNISDLNNVVNDILSGKGDPSMDVNVDGSVNISDINIIVQSILTTN